MQAGFPRFSHRQFGEPLATAAIVTLLVLSGAITWRNITRLREDGRAIATAYEVLSAVESISHSLEQSEAAMLAYQAIGHESDLTTYHLSSLNFDRQLQRLDLLGAPAAVYRPLIHQTAERLQLYRGTLQPVFLPLAEPLDRESSADSAGAAAPVAGLPPAAPIDPAAIVSGTISDEEITALSRQAAAAVAESLGSLRQQVQTLVASRLDESDANYRQARSTTLILSLAGLTLVAGVMWVVYRRRVQAERDTQRLAQESGLRQNTLDAFAKYVLVCDPNRRVVTINEALLNRFQLHRDDVIGQPIDQVAAGQWSEAGITSFVEQLIDDPTADRECEVQRRFATERERVLKLRGRSFSNEIYPGGLILVIINDITEQRELERRNDELDQHIQWFLAQVQDYAIFMMDTEYRATSWNPGVYHVLGYSEEEFLGHDVRPLIFTDESRGDGGVEAEFAAIANRGSISLDRWMRRKDGSSFWASGVTAAIRDDQGGLVGFSKVMRDMTEQKRNSDEVSRLAARSMEEVRHKSEFIATLAHEMRSPLGPIKTATELMGQMELSDELGELQQTVSRQTDQLIRLVADLTEISRLGHGKMEIKPQRTRLRPLLEAAVEASMTLIEANGQTLRWNPAEAELTLVADPARITQVVTNLLNNASKYSGAGCWIELNVSCQDEQIQLSVRDNGCGIEADQLEEIFEMFYQLGDGEERGGSGLGIGLMLVRTIAERHGGSVVARSPGRGQGSEFIVTLPAIDGCDQADQSPTDRPQAAPAPQRRYRILVVDDMRPLATLLARLLSKLDHEVEVVLDGKAALERLETFPADIVFSDISMPGISGYELAQRLRSNPATSHLTLVAMTGYGQSRDRDKALQAGFDEHLVKPVGVHKLEDLFAQLAAAEQARR